MLRCYGISHKTAPLELREKVAPSSEERERLLFALQRDFATQGVLLVTCNRVELYLSSPDGRPTLDDWLNLLGPEALSLRSYFYELQDIEVARRLFLVTTSLDSMALGETQIQGQVREAYLFSESRGTVGKVLNRLFQQALKVGKRLREETAIGAGNVSLAGIAVELASRVFDSLSGRRVMILGAGEMAEQALSHFAERGVQCLVVANRSHDKAVSLAKRFGGEAARFDNLSERLKHIDILVAGAGAPHFILNPETVRQALPERGKKPLVLIDLGAPRNLNPAIGELENVYLYNLDDLGRVAQIHQEDRQHEAETCLKEIERETLRFQVWQRTQEAAPLIVELGQRLHAFKSAELTRLLNRLPADASPELLRDEMERFAERLINKILHPQLHLIQDHDDGVTYAEEINRILLNEERRKEDG